MEEMEHYTERVQEESILIKKYANRRLYNTKTSTYINFEDLILFMKEGVSFHIIDSKTGEDITRQTLVQLLVEREMEGSYMLPLSFLKTILGFYGEKMQEVVPAFLEESTMLLLQKQQEVSLFMQKMLQEMHEKQKQFQMFYLFPWMNPAASTQPKAKETTNKHEEMKAEDSPQG